jgi:hypothetical protein
MARAAAPHGIAPNIGKQSKETLSLKWYHARVFGGTHGAACGHLMTASRGGRKG